MNGIVATLWVDGLSNELLSKEWEMKNQAENFWPGNFVLSSTLSVIDCMFWALQLFILQVDEQSIFHLLSV